MSKKEKIPSTVRNSVWNFYAGKNNKKDLCFCCGTEDISTANFQCGHVESEKNGGKINLENLRPICGQCNSSMGTMNMNTFMNKYGFKKKKNWDGNKDIDTEDSKKSAKTTRKTKATNAIKASKVTKAKKTTQKIAKKSKNIEDESNADGASSKNNENIKNQLMASVMKKSLKKQLEEYDDSNTDDNNDVKNEIIDVKKIMKKSIKNSLEKQLKELENIDTDIDTDDDINTNNTKNRTENKKSKFDIFKSTYTSNTREDKWHIKINKNKFKETDDDKQYTKSLEKGMYNKNIHNSSIELAKGFCDEYKNAHISLLVMYRECRKYTHLLNEYYEYLKDANAYEERCKTYNKGYLTAPWYIEVTQELPKTKFAIYFNKISDDAQQRIIRKFEQLERIKQKILFEEIYPEKIQKEMHVQYEKVKPFMLLNDDSDFFDHSL